MFFAFCEINATKFGAENKVTHKIIMQWKKSYYIASNVSSRKGATTFGDLPDCLKTPECHVITVFLKLRVVACLMQLLYQLLFIGQ